MCKDSDCFSNLYISITVYHTNITTVVCCNFQEKIDLFICYCLNVLISWMLLQMWRRIYHVYCDGSLIFDNYTYVCYVNVKSVLD